MEQQYYSPAPKKNNTGLIIGLVIGGIFLCCIIPVGALFGGGLWAFKKIQGTAGCMFTFSTVQRAVELYEKDHGGKLPKAETWQDDLRVYYRKSQPAQNQTGPFSAASAEGEWGCKESDGTMTGMAFNTDLSGKDASKIADAVNQVMIFETDRPSKNQHAKYKKLDPVLSPKIFNKPRGWFFINCEGDIFTDSPEKGVQKIGRPMMGSGVHVDVETSNVSHGSDNSKDKKDKQDSKSLTEKATDE